MSDRSSSPYEVVLRSQAESNRNVERFRKEYAGHRARMTNAIRERRVDGAARRLCLLGAGACLDVDLSRLAAEFAEIQLVDLDAAAVARARASVSPELRSRIALKAPVDLSGLLRPIERWRAQLPSPALLEAEVPLAVRRIDEAIGGGFDLVVSCCLLTQLVRGVTLALSADYPLLGEVVRRLALIHLRSMALAIVPGGRGLLVTDVVANDTFPLETLQSDEALGPLLDQLGRDGNFFIGAEPALLTRLIARDRILSQALSPATRLPPWLWRATPDKLFLVYALEFERKPAG